MTAGLPKTSKTIGQPCVGPENLLCSKGDRRQKSKGAIWYAEKGASSKTTPLTDIKQTARRKEKPQPKQVGSQKKGVQSSKPFFSQEERGGRSTWKAQDTHLTGKGNNPKKAFPRQGLTLTRSREDRPGRWGSFFQFSSMDPSGKKGRGRGIS